jgi:hypothetical protein
LIRVIIYRGDAPRLERKTEADATKLMKQEFEVQQCYVSRKQSPPVRDDLELLGFAGLRREECGVV